MSQFSFSTNAQAEEYCGEIVDYMVDHFNVSEEEALQRINMVWVGVPFIGAEDLRYHDTPDQFAKHLFYGKSQLWWLDERGLQPFPLEPATSAKITRFSEQVTMLAALEHEDARVRAWTVYTLCYWKHEDTDNLVKHALIHMLQQDSSVEVRYWAAHALGNGNWAARAPGNQTLLGDPASDVVVDALCKSLRDSERSVRVQAALSLGNLRHIMSVASLVEALHDGEGCVRWRVVQALGSVGDSRAVPALIPLLQDQELLVQRAVVDALGNLRDEQAILPILDLLESTTDKQTPGIEALTQLFYTSASSFPLLLEHLTSKNSVAKRVVIAVLGELNNKQASPALIHALENEADAGIRYALVKTLGSLKDERALPALIHALQNEPDVAMRKAVVRTLFAINDSGALDGLLKQAVKEEYQFRNEIINDVLQKWTKEISPERKESILQLRVSRHQRYREAQLTGVTGKKKGHHIRNK